MGNIDIKKCGTIELESEKSGDHISKSGTRLINTLRNFANFSFRLRFKKKKILVFGYGFLDMLIITTSPLYPFVL